MTKAQPWWKELAGTLIPAASGVVGGLKEAARETMDEAQRRIHETVRLVIKALIVFVIVAFGFIFLLVGLAKYLDATMRYMPGTGAMIIGGVLVLLGLFAWIIRR